METKDLDPQHREILYLVSHGEEGCKALLKKMKSGIPGRTAYYNKLGDLLTEEYIGKNPRHGGPPYILMEKGRTYIANLPEGNLLGSILNGDRLTISGASSATPPQNNTITDALISLRKQGRLSALKFIYDKSLLDDKSQIKRKSILDEAIISKKIVDDVLKELINLGLIEADDDDNYTISEVGKKLIGVCEIFYMVQTMANKDSVPTFRRFSDQEWRTEAMAVIFPSTETLCMTTKSAHLLKDDQYRLAADDQFPILKKRGVDMKLIATEELEETSLAKLRDAYGIKVQYLPLSFLLGPPKELIPPTPEFQDLCHVFISDRKRWMHYESEKDQRTGIRDLNGPIMAGDLEDKFKILWRFSYKDKPALLHAMNSGEFK